MLLQSQKNKNLGNFSVTLFKWGELLSIFHKLLLILELPGSIKAIITWPKFSLTSYAMVSSLVRQGVMPATIIDVGANVGQFTIASAKLIPDVLIHSFEPNPECVAKLRKNVKLLDNIVIYQLAVGDELGEIPFHVNSHSHSSSILTLADEHMGAFPDAREVGTIQVPLSTLDDVFADIELCRPILLKFDVQGYEAQAVRGAEELLKRIDYVVLEASFKPMYQGEMLFMDMVRMMESLGFVFLRPVGQLTDSRTNEIIQMDALFGRK